MTDQWRCADDVIESVDVDGVRRAAPPLNARRWGPHEHASVVSVRTAGGLVARSSVRAHVGLGDGVIGEQIRWVGRQVVGRSLAEHRAIWDELSTAVLRQYVSTFALGAVDTALWDLRARSLDTSVAALITPSPDPEVRAYASLPIVDRPDVARPMAAAVAAAGYAGVKVHTSGDLEHDVAVLDVVAGELAGRGFVAYDAAGRLGRSDAATVAERLERLGARWFEEPFGQFDLAAHEWLKERTSVPLAGLETAPGGAGMVHAVLAAGVLDLVCVDCCWKGGLTGAVETVRVTRESGADVVMHHGATPEMDAANVHLAAGLGTGPVEVMPLAGSAAELASGALWRVGSGATASNR